MLTQVKSFGGVVKADLYKSVDPLILSLDAKYGIHDSIPKAVDNVTKGDLVIIESKQMLQFRIRNGYLYYKGNTN